MLRIFKDAVYIRDFGKENQSDNKFESLAINSDYVVSILPCDENFDRADKEVVKNVSLITMTTGEMIMVPKSVEDVCKLLFGAKL